MRLVLTLLRNLVVALFTLTQNLLKALGLRGRTPDYVVFDLRGHPPHRPLPWRMRLGERLSGRRPTVDLHTLGRRFDALAKARGVRGVVLRVDGLTAGLPRLDALRQQVRRLREAGKEVIFWTPHGSAVSAQLLLSGDRLFIAPAGHLDIRGFAAEMSAFGPALERLGVGITVVRRGTHKTAADPLVRAEPSPEQRETLDAILDELDASLVESIAGGRGLDPEEARARIEEAPWSGTRADDSGLIDGRCYRDELPARLAREGQEKARLAPWDGFRASRLEAIDWKPILVRRRAIGVVSVRGLIVEGESRQMGPAHSAGHRSIAEALDLARRTPWIRAVVLEIDSRGGSALASDLMWREVRRTAEKKPVVAFFDTVAASGGYYCAAGANEIVAGPFALTGSIGVLSMLFELSSLYARLGIRREVLARGARAALGTTARPPTDSERAALETESETFYETFLDRVAEGRSLDRDEVAKRAEGRVYTGRRAQALGLVDALGNFEDAVARARALAGIAEAAPMDVVSVDPRRGGIGGGTVGAWMRSAAAAPSASLTSELLGLVDPFELAWLEASASSSERLWAVLPHRLFMTGG